MALTVLLENRTNYRDKIATSLRYGYGCDTCLLATLTYSHTTNEWLLQLAGQMSQINKIMNKWQWFKQQCDGCITSTSWGITTHDKHEYHAKKKGQMKQLECKRYLKRLRRNSTDLFHISELMVVHDVRFVNLNDGWQRLLMRSNTARQGLMWLLVMVDVLVLTSLDDRLFIEQY